MIQLRDASAPHVAEPLCSVELENGEDVLVALLGHRVRAWREVPIVAQLAALASAGVVLELDGLE
eukprot:1540113-Pyramimonas_sp.AAC.1